MHFVQMLSTAMMISENRNSAEWRNKIARAHSFRLLLLLRCWQQHRWRRRQQPFVCVLRCGMRVMPPWPWPSIVNSFRSFFLCTRLCCLPNKRILELASRPSDSSYTHIFFFAIFALFAQFARLILFARKFIFSMSAHLIRMNYLFYYSF